MIITVLINFFLNVCTVLRNEWPLISWNWISLYQLWQTNIVRWQSIKRGKSTLCQFSFIQIISVVSWLFDKRCERMSRHFVKKILNIFFSIINQNLKNHTYSSFYGLKHWISHFEIINKKKFSIFFCTEWV